MIEGDSLDYSLLNDWADFDCKGYYTCEIGVRKGLGSKIIMDQVKNNYFHIGVDPYGDRVYQHTDNDANSKWNGKPTPPTYPDSMRDQLIKDFHWYIKQGKFHLANMTDTDFMESNDYKDKRFALVHFDGPHTTKDVINESIWFANRSAPKTRFIFDDYKTYDMQTVADCLHHFNFKPLAKGENKILLEN